MTEFIAFLVLVAVAVAALLAYLRFLYARRDLARLREYEFFTDKFYKASKTLLSEDDLPNGVASCLGMLNIMISDERSAHKFFRIYEQIARQRIDDGTNEVQDAEIRDFVKSHPALEESIQDAFVGGL